VVFSSAFERRPLINARHVETDGSAEA
jgi:hypothetical protein